MIDWIGVETVTGTPVNPLKTVMRMRDQRVRFCLSSNVPQSPFTTHIDSLSSPS